MIQMTDHDGRSHYVAASAVAQISEAGPSSAWHGIRSFVKLFDGRVLEVQETPAALIAKMAPQVES